MTGAVPPTPHHSNHRLHFKRFARSHGISLAERVGLLVAPLLAPSGPPYRALSPLRLCLRRLIEAAENLPIYWRRGWDSNPRTRLGVTHFPGVRLRPLGHLSTRAARVPDQTRTIKSGPSYYPLAALFWGAGL
jgi:hypothetical protein